MATVSIERSALMTPEQVAANRIMLRLNEDPDVQAAQADQAAIMARSPIAASPDGKSRIGHVLAGWTNTLILREIAADPANPTVQWLCDDTVMHWDGMTIPHRSSSLMNPDRIYRGALFDGAGRYEIIGRVDPQHPPAAFSFEVTTGTAGLIMMTTANASTADLGDQVSILTGEQLDIAADGQFRITIGDGDGPNHLHTPPAPIAMTLRDALSDWSQRPNRLSIRRLDPIDAQPLGYDEIKARLLADLPGWVAFFADYPRTWLGGLAENVLRGPVPRDGGWGYLAAGRYRLDPGSALVITTARQSARYTGIQVTDPWLVAPDGIAHQTSLSNAQAERDPDGFITYVVSRDDPGVANWLDTGALNEGFVILRWEAMAGHVAPADLIRSVAVERIDALGTGMFGDLAKVRPAERRERLARRADAYLARLR